MTPEDTAIVGAGERKTEIKNLYLLHCTGENAIRYLRNALPECKIHTPVPGEILSF